MAKNLTGRIANAKEEAAELTGLLGKLKQSMEGFNFDPKNSIQNSKNNLKEIVDIAEKFNEYQNSIAQGGFKNAQLSAQELSNLKKQYKQAKDNLSLNLRSLQQRLSGLKAEYELLAKKDQLNKGEINRLQSIGKEISENKKLQTQLTSAIEDSDKSMKKLGKNIDQAAKAAKGIELGNQALQGMQKVVSMIPFSSWLNPLTAIGNIINIIVDQIKLVDEQTGKAAKSLNRSYEETASMRMAMANVAQSTGTLYDNSRDMLEVFTDLNKAMGTSLDFKNMTKEQQRGVAFLGKMYKYAGLTLEETSGLAKYAFLQRRDVEKMSGELMAQYRVTGLRHKVVLNEKDVLKEINNTAAIFKLTIEGGAKGLANALATTKALGTSLESVNGTAKGLLNFEDSIEKSLSAELLLGKKLNWEYMQTLAFNNQYAKLAEEIKKSVGDSSFFQEKNAIQIQALADALYMSKEQMAEMVASSETLKNASASSYTAEEAKYQALVKAHGEQGAMAIIAMQQLQVQNQQASVSEHMDALMQNLVDKQLPGIYNLLFTIKEIATKFFEIISSVLGKFDLIKEAVAVAAALIAGTLGFQVGMMLGKLILQLKAIYDQNAAYKLQQQILQQNAAILEKMAATQTRMNATQKAQNTAAKTQQTYEYTISGLKAGQATSSAAVLQSTVATNAAENAGKPGLLASAAAWTTKALGAISTAIASTLGAAAPLILGAIGAASAAYFAYTAVKGAMDDGVIGPGGDRVLLGAPGGPIKFNKQDTIVAGTNLMNDGVVYGSKGSISLGGGDVREEIMALKEAIISLANRPINVTATANGKNIVELKGQFPNEDGLTSAQNAFQIS
jgi:hypothetical protein